VAPAQRARKIGAVMSIALISFVPIKLINALVSAKADTLPDIPSLICKENHSTRSGANSVIIVIKTAIEANDVNSALCGMFPFDLVSDRRFGVGCSVLSVAGFSGISYIPSY
jgi:hypothetical protein